ncbi:MAG: type pilus assembly protein PilA [Frankiaceae bacterium]|jgi:prepilin-type N-terminal cleavage/methylation domain-containing protein|nr:type pilus assembly protein PilA [Frankiaceae bacterium]
MLARLHKMREEEGFTLIELLVVMIIIGILAAIAIPLFLNQRKNAVDASIKSDLRTLANEMESQYTDTQAYPATITQASAGAPVTVGTSSVRVSSNNSFTLALNATSDAFCLVGSDTKATHNWVYVSSQGGLQPAATTACPASF